MVEKGMDAEVYLYLVAIYLVQNAVENWLL
ncbi:hypothetical protein RP300_01361 [Oligella urethralis]|nr:hypothetical protein RP300_01361 [Oligella urethralis]